MKEHNYPYDFVQVQIYESDDVDRFSLLWLVCNLTSKKILLDRRYDEPLSIYSRLAANDHLVSYFSLMCRYGIN